MGDETHAVVKSSSLGSTSEHPSHVFQIKVEFSSVPFRTGFFSGAVRVDDPISVVVFQHHVGVK